MGAPPLAGIRVLEVGNYMAGPFCGMQLADLGADVVKVENPDGGDQVRLSAPFIDGESSNFVRLNRNKRSLVLNLKDREGKAVFRRLAARADVIVENLRPGTMGDLELDYSRLAPDNPGLIYVAASGWGQDGPYSQLAGLDIMAQGMSGLMSITGTDAGDPVKVGVPVCDLVCALYGALAAVAALNARARDGKGQFIDVSLFEAGVSLGVWEAGKYFATGEIPRPLGSAHQNSAPYQAIRAQDGWLTIGATSPRNWESFCRVLDREDLLRDPRYQDNLGRQTNRAELIESIEQVTVKRPKSYWLDALQEAGVPCGAIQDYGQVFHDPHLTQRGFFPTVPHPTLGEVEQIASPMRLSATPARMERAGPLFGEHSTAVLIEAGFSEQEVAGLAERGVILTS